MSTINMAGIMYMRKYSIKELINRLLVANDSLYTSTVEKKIPRMTYSKGGRVYETSDFLQMITKHIDSHAKQVRRSK